MKKKRLGWFGALAAIFLFGICTLSSCNNEEKNPASEYQVVPDEIDDAQIKLIEGFDDLEKKQIINHITQFYADGDFHAENEEEIASGFVSNFASPVTLTAFGDNFDFIDYKETTGISFCGTMIGFTFLQNAEKPFLLKDKTIEINDALTKKAGDYSFPANFRNGALVILKSFDQNNWVEEAKITSINRSYITFLPDEADVNAGVYYKFINIIQYKFFSHIETKTSGILFWKKTKEIEVWSTFNVLTEYDVSLGRSDVGVRFSCESINSYQYDQGLYAEDEIQILQKTSTLSNGSTSTSYIKAEFTGAPRTINYTFFDQNGGDTSSFETETTFTKPGKYVFTIETFFGVKNEVTLYLLNLGVDNGKSLFFGSGIVNEERRMFDPTKTMETYMVGKEYYLIDLPDYLPGRYGNLYYFETDNDLANARASIVKSFNGENDSFSGSFLTEGYYVFDLYSCDPLTASGDLLHYTIAYFISGNLLYAPFVNYGLITNPARSNLLASKVFAVSLPTTGGGAYQFIYPYSEKYVDKAYEMAVKIEELNIEIVEKNGKKYYYYKSEINPNIKTSYIDKVLLYDVVNMYAKKNINAIYLENDLPFADEVIDDNLVKLNESSIERTVRVVENNKVLADLRTGDIYLNDYVFTQVADFEVDSISAVGENNNQYDIHFDQEIDSLFSKSEMITITESNWNGSKVYQTIYSKNNTCELVVNDNYINKTIKSSADKSTFNSSSFKFISARDKYDSQTLIAIEDGKTRMLFSMEEIAGLSLPKGDYDITVINRNRQTYSFKVHRTTDLYNDECSFVEYNHDPLRANIADSVKPVETNTKASARIVLPIWAFILILVGAAVVFFVIGAILAEKIL